MVTDRVSTRPGSFRRSTASLSLPEGLCMESALEKQSQEKQPSPPPGKPPGHALSWLSGEILPPAEAQPSMQRCHMRGARRSHRPLSSQQCPPSSLQPVLLQGRVATRSGAHAVGCTRGRVPRSRTGRRKPCPGQGEAAAPDRGTGRVEAGKRMVFPAPGHLPGDAGEQASNTGVIGAKRGSC